jgi:hypothetical protein
MGDARLLYTCSSRRGNTHEGNPARNLVRFTQRKRRTKQLISLDCPALLPTRIIARIVN